MGDWQLSHCYNWCLILCLGGQQLFLNRLDLSLVDLCSLKWSLEYLEQQSPQCSSCHLLARPCRHRPEDSVGEFSMQPSSLSSWLFAMALSYYFITIDYFNFHLHNNVICIKRQGNYCRFCIWIFDDSFDQSKWSVTKKFHGLFHIHFHHKFHPICTMECKIIISELGFDKGHSRRWETVNIRKGRCVSAKLIIYYVLQCQHNRHQRSKPNTWKSWLAKVKAFGHNFFNQKFFMFWEESICTFGFDLCNKR